MKILKVKKRCYEIGVLPDGEYNGLWAGNTIEVYFKWYTYDLITEKEIPRINIKVLVTVKDGVATYKTI